MSVYRLTLQSFVCCVLTICVLDVGGRAISTGPSCSLRPNGYNVTQYRLELWAATLTRSCGSGKVYNQALCGCVPQPNCSITEGSHNSATSYITSSSEVSPDGSKLLNSLMGNWKEPVARWSRTQDITITAQLNAGIRYLDLRTAYNKTDNDFYIVHTLYSVKVSIAMKEVKAFLDAHPHEVVLLDFNHFYAMNNVLHTRLSNEVLALFGSKVCPVTPTSTLTLSYMWEQSKQVLVFYHATLPDNTNSLWPASSIPAPWANTKNISTLIAFLENRQNKLTSIFQVTQGILTPDFTSIIENVDSSLKEVMAIPTLEVFLPWLMNKVPSPTKMNIFTSDFVEQCDFIHSVIQLNM